MGVIEDPTDPLVAELTEAGIECGPVASFGGEGKGDEFWCVYEFARNTIDDPIYYVKFDSSYSLYDGVHFNSWYFVEPHDVTTTEYFPISYSVTGLSDANPN